MTDAPVTAEPDSEESWVEPPGLGKALVVGVVVGVVVSFIVVATALRETGQDWGAALGMGAFVAFWGGLGFGGMISGVIWATRNEAEEERVRHDQYMVDHAEAVPEDVIAA